MQGVTHNPHYVTETASWDSRKNQYRVIEYGQTVAITSSRKRAAQAVASARYYSTSAVYRRARKGR